MNPEQHQEDPHAQMTEAVGEVVGEVLVIISHVVKALRQQPGFDDISFEAALREMATQPEASMLQRHALQLIIDQES